MSARRRLATATVAVLAALLTASACRRAPERPDVLLVSIDRWRWERLSLEGGPVAMPRLQALARSGWRFSEMVSPSPGGAPAAVTLLTGQPPAEHGLRRLAGSDRALRLATLADVLAAGGWRTGAFANAPVLPAGVELDRGFEAWMVPPDPGARPAWARVAVESPRPAAAECQHWLRGLPEAEPAFAWLHLRIPEESPSGPSDHAIAEVDALVGLLGEQLDARGRARGVAPLLAVTALGGADERPGSREAFLLDEVSVRTQAIVKGAGASDGREVLGLAGLDELRDLLLALAGTGGESRLEALARGRAEERDHVLVETLVPMDALGALPRLRAVRSRDAPSAPVDPVVLQALAGDPGWPTAFRGPEPESSTRAWSELERAARELDEGRAGPARDRLAASSSGWTPAAHGARLLLAAAQLAAGETEAAIATGRSVLRRLPPSDPLYRTALLELSEAELAGGRPSEARRLLETLLESRPEDVEAWLRLGRLSRLSGEPAEALATLGRALSADRRDPRLLAALARVHAARGRPDLASQALGDALRRRPVDAALLFEAAEAALEAGDSWTALDRLETQRRIFGRSAESSFRVARVYGREHRCRSAAWFYTEALEQEPLHFEARVGLGQALLECGREDDGRLQLVLARAQRPDSPEPCRVLTSWLGQQGREEELAAALDECRAAHSVDPVLSRLGLTELPLRRLEGADRPASKLSSGLREGLFPAVRRDEPLPLCLDFAERLDLDRLGAAFDEAGLSRDERAAFLWDLLLREERSRRPFLRWLSELPGVGDLESHPGLARACFTGTEEVARSLAERREVAWIEGALEPGGALRERPEPAGEPLVVVEGWAPVALGAGPRLGRDFDGRGVVVALLDSGVDPGHPALAGRGVGRFPPPGEERSRAHGLQALAAAVGAGGLGVAPGASWAVADPIGANVLDPRAFAACLDWLLRDLRPDVVLVPWDVPRAPGPGLARAFGALRTAGAACVFPAGHLGPAPGLNRPPANLPRLAPDGAPALSVAGSARDGSVHPASSRGPNAVDGSLFPQLTAPAVGVELADPSRRAPGVLGDGTSFAAGFAAGALAVVLQARPELSGPQAESLLRETARDLGAPGPDPVFGHGRIDLAAALAAE